MAVPLRKTAQLSKKTRTGLSLDPDLVSQMNDRGIRNVSEYIRGLIRTNLAGGPGHTIPLAAATRLRLAAQAPDCPAFVRDAIMAAVGQFTPDEAGQVLAVQEFAQAYGRRGAESLADVINLPLRDSPPSAQEPRPRRHDG